MRLSTQDGTGNSQHLASELVKSPAKIDLNAIPYKGGAPAINALLGGQIPMSFNNGPESVGQIEAGTVRALAVTTASRASLLPDVPSMAETVPGYDTEVWWGLLGPAGMTRDLVEKLSHDFVAALNTEAVKERLTRLWAPPVRPAAAPRTTACLSRTVHKSAEDNTPTPHSPTHPP